MKVKFKASAESNCICPNGIKLMKPLYIGNSIKKDGKVVFHQKKGVSSTHTKFDEFYKTVENQYREKIETTLIILKKNLIMKV